LYQLARPGNLRTSAGAQDCGVGREGPVPRSASAGCLRAVSPICCGWPQWRSE